MSNEWTPGEGHDTNIIAAYLEGRLETTEEARFLAHAARCAVCRETIANFARASREVDEAPGKASGGTAGWPRSWMLPAAAALVLAAGTALVVQQRRDAPTPPGTRSPSPSIHLPTETAPPAPAPQTGQPVAGTPSAPTADPSLTRRRGGERRVGTKVFRLEAGEWVDREYDPLAAFPVVQISTRQEQAALLRRLPVLRQYAALGDRVTVVHAGTVYRFSIPPRT